MKTVKTFSLTSENLKKFEKELQEKDRKRHSLQRNIIPERTEADGRSSGIHSYGSQLSVFKETLNDNSKHMDTKKLLNSNNNSQGPRKYSYSLDRPEREAFRRNPEGQSRNESSHATPHIVKINYEEGNDRINYNSDSEKERKGLVSDEDDEEESDDDDDSSDDDEDEDDESDEESDESDDQSDDDDDETETETIPKRLLATPTTVRTHYTSSINASVSSIPTVASVKNRPESTNTIKTTKTARKGSALSNASSAPSYILNMNQYRMKKMTTKKEKERDKLGAKLTESELSYGPSRPSNASAMSMRERGTTSVQSNGSYVATRNWSRWSNYSLAGYSISEGPESTRHTFRKQAKKKSTSQKTHGKTSRHRPQSRSPVAHLPVTGKSISSKSVPDLRKTGKRHVTLTLDPGLSRARAASRSQIASRLSTRSIIKRPTTTRVKSVPDLNKQAVMSYFEMEREIHKSASRSGVRKKRVKAAETIDYRGAMKQKGMDINDDIDFTNRRKRVRKLKERPKRQRNETSLSSASSLHSNLRRRNKLMHKSGSSLSSTLSMSSLKSSQTGKSWKPAPSRASSKASLLSRKARLPPLKKYAGYQSGRDHMSSGASFLAPGTPFSMILKRSPSLRSVVTEYSSYLSLAASSAKSARPTSRSSLLSTDGESTAIGPQASSPDKEEEKEIKQHKPAPEKPQRIPLSKASEKQPKRSSSVKEEKQNDSESERLQLPDIRPQSVASSIKSPYLSSVKVVTPKEIEQAKKKKKKLKLPEIVRVNHPLPNFTEATRDTGVTRLVKLVKPKESKAVWMTSFWPIVWGNQDMMWPISRAALSANASERLMTLATPKKDFQLDHPLSCNRGEYVYSCGRESVIWNVQPLALKTNISARVNQLAEPKKLPPEHKEQREAYIFSCGRSSPVWHVSEAAKTVEERERSMRLAQAKKCHPHYQPEREVPWIVSEPAKRAVSSARVEQLARPKTRQDGLIREPTWRVSSASRRTVASARVQELAKPKQTVEGYLPSRETEWAVSKSTLRAIASERMQTLSKPIIRETMDHVQFNPDAFTVSETARKANASQRIVELAQPISRGHK